MITQGLYRCSVRNDVVLLAPAPLISTPPGESTTPPGTPQHTGSASAMSSTSPKFSFSDSTLSPSKKRYVADTMDVDVVKKIKQNEVELRDRNSVLRGVKPVVSVSRRRLVQVPQTHRNQNFSAIRAVYTDKLKKMKESSKPGAASQPSTPSAGKSIYSMFSRRTLNV